MATHENFLKIPLNKLYFIEDVNTFTGLKEDDLESFKHEYDEMEIKSIVESVRWATQNPDYDFSSLLPNLQHDNADIYKYLCKLKESLASL